MTNRKTATQSDFFSEDPEENLRIENEILHLKLKAELGGEVIGNQVLPPDMENQFLKNVLEFEHACANTRQVSLFDFIGKPTFKKSSELNDEEINVALKALFALLDSKNIALDFSNEYNLRIKYQFITEELFAQEIDDIEIPGLITHYIYEEFHPNHRSDIESRAIEFIEGWLDQEINEDSWELSDSFILPDDTVLSKKDVVQKINTVFAFYPEFTGFSYSFEKISFELKGERQTGRGYVSGFITYDAVLENGDKIHVEGPFHICLSMVFRWWSIFYFSFPGFKW